MFQIARARIPLLWRLVCAGAIASGLGCGATPAANCPTVSSTCPSPSPGYADVAPIIQARCAACHSPGGVEASRPFQTYADITKPGVQIDILTQVRACLMPQAGAPPLTDDERTTLLGWLYCDAPLDGGVGDGGDH